MGWVSTSTISEHSEGDFHVVMRSGSQALTGEIYFAPGIITEGKNLALPVCIQGEDIIALRLWLIYDNDALKLVSVSNGEVLGGMTLKTQMDDALYCMLWSDSLKEGPHPIHGTLAELQFNIRENVEQSEVSILCIIQSGDAYGGNLNQVIIEQKEALLALYASDKGVLYIPKYTAVIKREAFAGCAFETVYLTNSSLTTIESRAFANSPNLRWVFMGTNVSYIADDAFDGCENLILFYNDVVAE